MKVPAILLAMALCLLGLPANAPAGDLVEPYARALRAFNAALSLPQAQSLARATLAAADLEGIDARLLVAVVAVESRWNPAARSPAGAIGLGQLMPSTAEALGIDATDPRANIAGAALTLRRLLDRFSSYDRPTRYRLAIAAYNAGLGAVERYGGVPPYGETQRYVRLVLSLWRRLSAGA